MFSGVWKPDLKVMYVFADFVCTMFCFVNREQRELNEQERNRKREEKAQRKRERMKQREEKRKQVMKASRICT